MLSNRLILYLVLLLPSVFPSIRVLSDELALPIRSKHWSFSFSISPSNDYSGLISFRIDRLDLLAVQVILKSLLQHHSAKATVRTGHGTTDWFQIAKGVRQGCTLSPCLFNFYAEYIMRNAGL